MKAKPIMLQGTGSDVGKSFIAAALCRIFKDAGYSVSPFKSQNMSSVSYITNNGEEISTAQALQAYAAGIEPSAYMNPILLKPKGDMKSDVIILGSLLQTMSASEYHTDYTLKALDIVRNAYIRLASEYDIIVIEGAGSPAEVNLKATEIVNMRIAKMTDAPVILIVDIDRGGAFAWVVGTLELLEPDERKRVSGIIINKFRGDKKLLDPAIYDLEKRINIPVLGVIPYMKNMEMPREDTLGAETSDSKNIDKTQFDGTALEKSLKMLATTVRENMNMEDVYNIIGL